MIDVNSILLAFCIVGAAAFIVYLGWDTISNSKEEELSFIDSLMTSNASDRQIDLAFRSEVYLTYIVENSEGSLIETFEQNDKDLYDTIGELGYRGLL